MLSLRILPIEVLLPGLVLFTTCWTSSEPIYTFKNKYQKHNNYPILRCCPSVYFLLKYFSPDWCYSPPVGLHRNLSTPSKINIKNTTTILSSDLSLRILPIEVLLPGLVLFITCWTSSEPIYTFK